MNSASSPLCPMTRMGMGQNGTLDSSSHTIPLIQSGGSLSISMQKLNLSSFSCSVNSGFAVVVFIVSLGSASLALRHKYAALQLASLNMAWSLGLLCTACRHGEWGWWVLRLGMREALCMWRAALAWAGGLRAMHISPVPQY